MEETSATMTATINWTLPASSFSQRYGYEPLPKAMQLEHLCERTRTGIFNVIYDIISVDGDLGFRTTDPVSRMCRRAISDCLSIPQDTIPSDYSEIKTRLKKLVLEEPFNKTLDLLQYIANYRDDRTRIQLASDLNGRLECFPGEINHTFDRYGAAYMFDMSGSSYCIYPRTSIAQGLAVQNSLAMLKINGRDGAVVHLRKAAKHLNSGEHADSIVDSIHAVESVACLIDPAASRTLGPAINSLRKRGILKHAALAEAFKKLYGYTCDEKGIRHSLVDQDAPNVGMNEAVFMFGACASFAAYLGNASRQKGTEKN